MGPLSHDGGMMETSKHQSGLDLASNAVAVLEKRYPI